METHWAEQNLATIRTLMERAAIYRRALAPVMSITGAIGLVASAIGVLAKMDTAKSFILYWITVSVIPLACALFLVRRQALKDSEAFWSPPTRRVTQAMLPPLAAGFALTAIVLLKLPPPLVEKLTLSPLLWLPSAWVILYGCAVHAAGFFMPRGMKLFGWIFIFAGCSTLALGKPDSISLPGFAHGMMGLFFGLAHLAYGIYLSTTERSKSQV